MNRIDKIVLVLIPADAEHRALMESAAPGAEFHYTTAQEVTREQVQAANIILGNPPVGYLSDSPNLELLQLSSAGANGYTVPGALPQRAALCCSSGAYGLAVAEFMLASLLCLFKDLPIYRDQQNQGLWRDNGEMKAVWGSTILVVGLGDIGGEFAARVKALGAHTIGVRRTTADKPDYIDELYRTDELDALLPRADAVALSLPSTPETRRLMDARRLALCKEEAVLINAGRGDVFDTEALCDALESGRIAGAAMDVTDPEPLPPEHRLWRAKNALITPHVSGVYHIRETYERVAHIALTNLAAHLAGQPLISAVDRRTGYRAT